jgi:ribokinase
VIVVFGSVNVDFVTRVQHVPRPGETVLGPDYAVLPGGKGANQALAAARAGARVVFVGAVGDDPFADIGLRGLAQGGVDLSRVARVGQPTGAAFISVDDAGENAIVVASGANRAADASALDGLAFGPGDTLLVQGELSETPTLAAARWAREQGGRVVLNMAPAGGTSRALIGAADILIVNEEEARVVAHRLGLSGDDPDETARMIDADCGIVCVVTLGSRGVIGWHGGVRRAIPALEIRVVDTTGAGDAFCGAFVAALDSGFGFSGALRRGVAAGGLACMQPGAQTGLPDRAAITAAVGDNFT